MTFIIMFILLFNSCTTTNTGNVSAPSYYEETIMLENGNLVHYYLFANEEDLWRRFSKLIDKEFDIQLSDVSVNKIPKSVWKVDEEFDKNLKDYMMQNGYKYAICSYSESSDASVIVINQLLNTTGYSKKWSFSKPQKVDVETDIPWWLFFVR